MPPTLPSFQLILFLRILHGLPLHVAWGVWVATHQWLHVVYNISVSSGFSVGQAEAITLSGLRLSFMLSLAAGRGLLVEVRLALVFKVLSFGESVARSAMVSSITHTKV